MGNFPWGPHGPQAGPNQVTPNPTPAWVPPPPAPSWSPSPQPAAPSTYGGPVQNAGAENTGYAGIIGPRRKRYWVAILLTLLFGPVGLLYASKKGALIMIVLLFAVPIGLGSIGFYPAVPSSHPLGVLEFDSIMNPMYSLCVFLSLIWSVFAVHWHNAAVKAAAA